ncbi:MAG TPA: hypothetical protein VEH29_08950, partial [Acidimicrobiales bacterium]|nr:hypothetical protein [Acidimicrobiales bacterium]
MCPPTDQALLSFELVESEIQALERRFERRDTGPFDRSATLACGVQLSLEEPVRAVMGGERGGSQERFTVSV